MIRKTYKYRLYPNKAQRELLEKYFGACRWVYNWGLERKSEEFKKEKKNLSVYDLMNDLPNLKKQKEFEWLNEPPAQCLQQSLKDLDMAFTNFFRKQNKYPKFKSKKNGQKSCHFPQTVKINFEYHKIKLNKIGSINIRLDRIFDGKIKTTTIKRIPSGKYFAFVVVELDEEIPPQKPLNENKAIGIDLGIRTLIVTSNGEKYENHKFLERSLNKLRKEHRKLDRKKKGSKNKEKQRVKLARLYEKITNQRHDNLHKISRQLVNENKIDTFCLENLAIKEMSETSHKRESRSIKDVAWGCLVRFLEYKSKWVGKNILKIGRFDPSSKMCSKCGYIKHDLKMSDLEWVCPKCGTKHDRDFNAAINIKDFAFHPQRLLEFKLRDLGKKVGQEVSELHRKMRTPAERSYKQNGIRKNRNGRKSQLHEKDGTKKAMTEEILEDCELVNF
jgi:putative transposase